jgi:cobalt-zinc-cadmium efflux system membrane fusion protein
MKLRAPRLLLPGLGLALILALAACHADRSGRAEHMTSFESANSEGAEAPLFELSKDEIAHLEIETVARAPLERKLRLSGRVVYDGLRTVTVITPIGGPVSRILVVPGQHVEAGQALLEVKSPDYAALRAGYRKARDAASVAEANYKRAVDLYAHGAIAEEDLLAARLGRSQSQADLTAAAQGLRALGIGPASGVGAGDGTVSLRAPIAGEVVELKCAAGELLQANTTQCYTISDTSRVWVLLDVPQAAIPEVQVGAPVSIHTDAFSEPFDARIDYVASSLDADTRTLGARLVVENPGGRLKSQMYVTATIAAGTVPNAIAVPDAAVLRDDEDLPFVYVAAGGGRFRRQSVKIGDSADGRTRILAGLDAGDRVVADGALFLQFQNALQH